MDKEQLIELNECRKLIQKNLQNIGVSYSNKI